MMEENINNKQFWKTSKQLLKLDKKSQSFPTLFMNNKCAESDMEKANMLNSYFALQSMVNDNNHPLPQTSSPQHQLLQSINISVQDVTDVLENLDISKACGPDLISPRLLKEGSSILVSSSTVL